MKKFIIFSVYGILLVSCILAISTSTQSCASRHSGGLPEKEIIKPIPEYMVIEVIRPHAVERIADTKEVNPIIGEIVFVKEVNHLSADGKMSRVRYLWGKLDEKVPENIYLDLTSVEFYPVKVMETIIPQQ